MEGCCENHQEVVRQQGSVATALKEIDGKLDLLIKAIHQGDVTFAELKLRVGHLEKFGYGLAGLALSALLSGLAAIMIARG